MSIKKKLHMASPQQTRLWFQFHLKTMGYNYFSRLDGKKVEPYIIFYRHMNNPRLLHLVDGSDQSVYTRSNKKDWLDGECKYDLEIDTHNMQILKNTGGAIGENDINGIKLLRSQQMKMHFKEVNNE